MKLIAEISCYAVFAFCIGALSAWPNYELLGNDRAILSLVFSHAAERLGECRSLTQEELNSLPPNMRKPRDCPRERHPVVLQLRSGTSTLYSAILQPSGIWSDGKASIYQRIEVEAGTHRLFVGMNDSGGVDGFDYELSYAMDVEPGRNIVIQFDELTHTFSIR